MHAISGRQFYVCTFFNFSDVFVHFFPASVVFFCILKKKEMIYFIDFSIPQYSWKNFQNTQIKPKICTKQYYIGVAFCAKKIQNIFEAKYANHISCNKLF